MAVFLPLRVHDDESGQWRSGPSIQPALYPASKDVAQELGSELALGRDTKSKEGKALGKFWRGMYVPLSPRPAAPTSQEFRQSSFEAVGAERGATAEACHEGLGCRRTTMAGELRNRALPDRAQLPQR